MSLAHWLPPGLPCTGLPPGPSESTTASYYSSSRTLVQPSPPVSSSPLRTNPFLWLPQLHMEFSSCIPYQDNTVYVNIQDKLLESLLTPSFPPCMSHLQPVATHCSITTVLISPTVFFFSLSPSLLCSGLHPFSPGPFLVLWSLLQQSLTWIPLPVFQTLPFPNRLC